MGQRDIATFFGGKPAGTGHRDIASFFGGKPAGTSASQSSKPAGGAKAASSPAAKASGSKRTASTQPVAEAALSEAAGPGQTAAEQADGAAPFKELRESNNVPAEAATSHGKGGLKRLRKAASDSADAAGDAKKARAEAAAAAAADLMDDDAADGQDDGGPKPAAASAATPAGDEAAAPVDQAANGGAASPAKASSGSKRMVGPEAELAEASFADEQPAAARTKGSPKRGRKKVVAALAEAVKEEEDALTDASDSEAPERGEDDDGDAGEEGSKKKAAKKPVKKAVLKFSLGSAKKGTKADKVEGVGLGAIAAAAKLGDVDPLAMATWQPGEPVPFSFLVDAFDSIAEESKRLAMTNLLASALRTILATTPADMLPVLYLCTNRIAPAHEGIELGIGDAILMKALMEATGRSMAQLKKELEVTGDMGSVAAASRGSQRTMMAPKRLTVQSVMKQFRTIAATSGNKSQDRKRGVITTMLAASKPQEAAYLMRALQGKLRIGLAEQTVLVALAHAVLLHRDGIEGQDLAARLEGASQAVRMAYSQCPSFDVLVPALLEHGPLELGEHVRFVPGVPVKPMLAKPTLGVGEVLEKFTGIEFTCEYKYDGERAQVHVMEGGKIAIYSRNSENNTDKYPDIVADLPRLLRPGVQSVVLDCEAVAYDRVEKKILPFQILSTRKRKDVKVEDVQVKVCLYAFDCLYLNGETLLQQPLSARREKLYSALIESPGELWFAEAKVSREVEELATFLDESVKAGTEGLIVKTLDSTYEPSKRSAHWLKLKKDYMDGVGDTFDTVVIGAWHGRGKRKGVYGAYLLAIWDAESEEYQSISKIGTGFDEAQLASFHALLKPTVVDKPRPDYRYGSNPKDLPEVWFEPTQVWEVKAADLSISPVHCAALGLVDETKGISIRFPRLVRVRDDKSPEDATSAAQVADMYKNQAIHNTKGGGNKADDEDY